MFEALVMQVYRPLPDMCTRNAIEGEAAMSAMSPAAASIAIYHAAIIPPFSGGRRNSMNATTDSLADLATLVLLPILKQYTPTPCDIPQFRQSPIPRPFKEGRCCMYDFAPSRCGPSLQASEHDGPLAFQFGGVASLVGLPSIF